MTAVAQGLIDGLFFSLIEAVPVFGHFASPKNIVEELLVLAKRVR